MEYKDLNPENQQFVEEIKGLQDFNNLHGHFPGQFYRKNYERSKEYGLTELVKELEKNSLPFWQLIDEFIRDNNFDVDAYWNEFNKRCKDAEERSQISLAPLYIFLRKKGYSKQDITG